MSRLHFHTPTSQERGQRSPYRTSIHSSWSLFQLNIHEIERKNLPFDFKQNQSWGGKPPLFSFMLCCISQRSLVSLLHIMRLRLLYISKLIKLGLIFYMSESCWWCFSSCLFHMSCFCRNIHLQLFTSYCARLSFYAGMAAHASEFFIFWNVIKLWFQVHI